MRRGRAWCVFVASGSGALFPGWCCWLAYYCILLRCTTHGGGTRQEQLDSPRPDPLGSLCAGLGVDESDKAGSAGRRACPWPKLLALCVTDGEGLVPAVPAVPVEPYKWAGHQRLRHDSRSVPRATRDSGCGTDRVQRRLACFRSWGTTMSDRLGAGALSSLPSPLPRSVLLAFHLCHTDRDTDTHTV